LNVSIAACCGDSPFLDAAPAVTLPATTHPSTHQRVSRRNFIAGITTAAIVGNLQEPTEAAAPAPRPPIHLFSKLLQWLDYDNLAEVTAAAGYTGIELTVRPGGHVEPERVAADLPRAVAAAKRAGITVEMIVTAINSSDDPQTEAVLRAAAAAGVKLYRLGYLRYQDLGPIEPQLAAMQRTMHNLAQLNERCAITGCYQNHHGGRIMGASIWDLRTVLGDLDPAWMGCQYDIRHAVAEATGSWEQGLQIIMPRIRSLALKDFRWRAGRPLSPETVPAGTGLVPWQRYADLIRAAGHTLPLTAHCEWPTFSPAEESLPIAQRKQLATERMAAERAFLQTVFSDPLNLQEPTQGS
jgi:L-ribulose-5-phosphate 3-epimerase